MKLDKAIEILQLYMKPSDDIEPVDLDTAIKLSIEALKAIDGIRKHHHLYTAALLPGETPDNPPNRSLHHIKEVLESPLSREPKG